MRKKETVGKEIFEALNKVVSFIPAPIYWENTDSIIMGANKHVLTAIGIKSLDEYVGKSLYELYPKEMADNIKFHNEDVMRTKKTLSQEEAITDLTTKEIRYYQAVKSPLYDERGTVIGVIGTSIEITDRKKIEIALQDSQVAAEAANEAKSEFIQNMEHQLRTPFSGIYSIVEMLYEIESDEEKKDFLKLTYESAREFLELLNNIIDFSRNESQNKTLTHKKFDLKTLISTVITMEKAVVTAKKLYIKMIYPSNLPQVFIGDPHRLQRLLLNLVGNAIRFTQAGGVTIQVKKGKKLNDKEFILQLIVQDTGIGIEEDKQDYIYEKFYRLSPANQNKYKGAGLGLYVVKKIITELNGEIDVISSKNKGTMFICTLPFTRPLLDQIHK